MPLTRARFKKLADLRLREARELLKKGYPNGANYLAGYAVECALKACIAKKTRKYEFPPEPAEIRLMYSHSFKDLLKAADLDTVLAADRRADRDLDIYWNRLDSWGVALRYETSLSRADAQDLLNALDEPTHGVMQWLRAHW
mgnify:CR=1 FL=1|jgi:HEPN domain.